MPSDQQPARWLADFQAALAARDKARLQALFADECYWRDFLAFTWNIVTLEGRERIWNMLLERLGEVKPEKWQIEQTDEPGDTIGAWFSFETAVGRGKGHLRLKDGRCWTFFTTLRELKGHEEKRGPTRIAGTTRGVVKGRRSWLDGRNDEKAELGISRQPYCLIVGGGQGGLALAARLKQLGVPTLIVDALQRAGRRLAQALQIALPARSRLVRSHAVSALSGSLADLHAQGQDGRLAGGLRLHHGTGHLERDDVQAG